MRGIDEVLISRETQRAILAALSAKQLAVVALRWDGLKSCEIAEELGLSEQVVSARLRNAQGEILRQFPEWATWAKGRNLNVGVKHRDREAERSSDYEDA